MKNAKIKIGHGAYRGANALDFVIGKTAAVAELMRRGIKRVEARAAIDKIIASAGGYYILDVRGKLVELEHIKPADTRYAENFNAPR